MMQALGLDIEGLFGSTSWSYHEEIGMFVYVSHFSTHKENKVSHEKELYKDGTPLFLFYTIEPMDDNMRKIEKFYGERSLR